MATSPYRGFQFPAPRLRRPPSRSRRVDASCTDADAHADHESTAGSGDERRPATEEKAVERTRTSTARKASASNLGITAPARSARAAGPDESHHRRANRSGRTGSQEMARSVAADDPPWRRSADGTGLRADHRNSRAIQVRQTDRQLCWTDTFGGFQCRPPTAGTHHQTRQLSAAFPAGRSSTSSSALGCGLETTVCAPGDAPAKEHRQGGHVPKTGRSVVLDVAERLGVFRVGQVRFARGTARYQAWRELERRPHEWASRSFARGSLK